MSIAERALALQQEIGDPVRIATVLSNLGGIHHARGDMRLALDFQERALEMREKAGDRPGIAKSLGNLAMIHAALGDDAGLVGAALLER